MKNTPSRTRIIDRLLKMQAELRQMINDYESWKDNRPEEVPCDVGWEKEILHTVDQQLAAWDRDDLDAVKAWSDKMKAACESQDSER